MEETSYFTPPGSRLDSANALAPCLPDREPLNVSHSSRITALPTPPVDSFNNSPVSSGSSTIRQASRPDTISGSPLVSSIPAYLRFPIPSLNRLYAVLRTPFPGWHSKSDVLNTTPEDVESLRQRYPFRVDVNETEDEMPRGYPHDTVGGAAFFAWEYVAVMSNLALKYMEKPDRVRQTT